MKIEKVAVLGAGAVGSYVIWGLSQKKEIRLGVIAEGERAERLKRDAGLMESRIIPKYGHRRRHRGWICWLYV